MKQDTLFFNGTSTMSSSVQFGTNSQADSVNFNYENTPKPATREKHVMVRYGGRQRITGFLPSSLDSYKNSNLSNSGKYRPSTTTTMSPQETGRYSEPTTSRYESLSVSQQQRPFKSTQRPYTTSARLHKTPSFNEALRADIVLKANRLYEEHTIGPRAQVPLKYRPSTVGGEPNNNNNNNNNVRDRPATTALPVAVEPVRGEVVLTSLRSQPTPPKNSVRTRAKGELVYNGPSHLLREQAKLMNQSQAQQPKDTTVMNYETITTSHDDHHRQLDETAFGLEYFDKFSNNDPQQLLPQSSVRSESSSRVTSLSFVSEYGNPRIASVRDLVNTYEVEFPPDRRARRKQAGSKASPSFKRGAGAGGRSDDSTISMNVPVVSSPIKSKFRNMPRFPIR
jgi:hypothetical protein